MADHPSGRAVPVPAWRITLDGQDLTANIDPRLLSISITEKRDDAADQLDLTIHDHDGRMAIPKPKAKLRVSLGWLGADGAPDLVDKGLFIVDDAEYSGSPDIIVVRARSADFTEAMKERRTRSWRDTTLGAVLRDIASPHGLEPAIAADLAGRPVTVIAQSRESDSALLARLGRLYDAVATVKSGRLIFSSIGAGKTPSATPIPDFSITRRDGDQHLWKRSEQDKVTGVRAMYHDRAAARRKSVLAGKAGKVRELRKTYPTEAAARTAAAAAFTRAQRGAATFSLVLAYGRADLYPERKGSVSGWKPDIDGTDWLIAEANHRMDGGGGFTTALTLETAV